MGIEVITVRLCVSKGVLDREAMVLKDPLTGFQMGAKVMCSNAFA